MCGIAGFVDFRKRSNLEELKSMCDTLKHRGPDGEGQEVFETEFAQIGLGHRRLAIIELTELGKQPMLFEHLHITFNGEIYNYKEIRNELRSLGHAFKSDSDTEVILHAFAEWKEKCVEHFVGMFAFVIYDSSENCVYAFRDRAGVKPFYYYFNNDLFLFASELKAIKNNPEFIKELNTEAIHLFLAFGNIPSPHCIYNFTQKLAPAAYIKIDLTKKPQSIIKIEQQFYWSVYDAYAKPKLNIELPEAIFETEKILQKAFEYRMVSDVPVGIFLSGGYDSACVTALLQKDNCNPLRTFTIAVPDIGLNEAPYAKEVARYLGTNHNEFECTQKEALELIPQLPHFYDEPFADSSAIPTMLVSAMARKQVTVALSADGGDEVFAGYNRYEMMQRYGTKLNKIPKIFRKGLAGFLDTFPLYKLPPLKNKYNIAQRYDKTISMLRNPSKEQIMMGLSELFTAEKRNELLVKKLVRLPETAYENLSLKNASSLQYMQAIDYTTYLPDDILTKVDRASMHCSLESREPFLDQNIIEWAARLPDEFKLNGNNKKFILKEIVHKYIPKELMDRPKMGFAIPIENWLQNDLKDLVYDFINENKLKTQAIFSPKAVLQLRDDFYNGKREYANKIWYILMFQMWLEKNYYN